MKRIYLILIVLILAVFGVSAAVADTASLYMSTSVDPIAQVLVGDSNKILPTEKSSFEAVGPIATEENPFTFGWAAGQAFNGTNYFAAFVMANDPGTYSVSTTAQPLKTPGATPYVLPYYVKIGSEAATKVEGSGLALTLISNFSVTAAEGLKFAKSDAVTIEVKENDYEKAGAGDYSSTWTINLIKN